MTKTTEELKREMYELLNDVKEDFGIRFKITKFPALDDFESALEAYLEALRLEAVSQSTSLAEVQKYSAILSDAYERQKGLTHAACVSERETWGEIQDLKYQLRLVREERDTERNRAQAFEYANKSAGEFLQEARTKIKVQRQSIGQLKNERDNAVHALKVKDSKLNKVLEELSELRKVVGSTAAQNREVLISCAKCGGTGRELIGMHAQDHAPVTVPCSKCAHLRGAQEPKMEFVCRAEFDDFIRVSCTVCGQEKDAPK